VPQDEPMGKMNNLAEQGAFAGTRGKNESLPLLEKGAGNSRIEYRDLIGICREKIKKAKVHAVVRDNKKCFYEYINNKKRAKENLHPLLDVGGIIANKDEEKAEVLNAFFASVFNRVVISRAFSPLSWKTAMDNRINLP